MKTSPKIDNDFVTVYSNEIDAKKCIDLIEKISTTSDYFLEDVERRPHKTMIMPAFYDKEDSTEQIELKSIVLSIFTKYMYEYICKKRISNIELFGGGMIVSKLSPGRSMETHIDVKYPELNPNGFIAMIYINDDYEGGEIYFENHNFSYKPSSGDIVFYQMAEPHGVRACSINDRYNIGFVFRGQHMSI